MSFVRVMKPLVAVCFLAIVTIAAGAQPAPNTPAYPGYGMGMGSPMGFLAPEERMMHFAIMQRETAGMSFDQMRAYRWAQRDKLMAMSAAERQRYAADLRTKWNALSGDDKARIQQQYASWRNDRPMRGRGGGCGGCGGW